jgi:hypothetical protein
MYPLSVITSLLLQMGGGLVDTKRVLVNNTNINHGLLLRIEVLFSFLIKKRSSRSCALYIPVASLARFACLHRCWQLRTVEMASLRVISTQSLDMPVVFVSQSHTGALLY